MEHNQCYPWARLCAALAPHHLAATRAGPVQEITRHTLVHEQLIRFYGGFKHDAHPMAIMVQPTRPACTCTGAADTQLA